jgi:hypothetical protein
MTTPTTIMSSLIYCVNPHKATTVTSSLIYCVNPHKATTVTSSLIYCVNPYNGHLSLINTHNGHPLCQ